MHAVRFEVVGSWGFRFLGFNPKPYKSGLRVKGSELGVLGLKCCWFLGLSFVFSSGLRVWVQIFEFRMKSFGLHGVEVFGCRASGCFGAGCGFRAKGLWIRATNLSRHP